MDLAALRAIPLFAALSDPEIQAMRELLQVRSYPPDHLLFREGELGDFMVIILSGQIEIIKALGTPEERRLGLRGPGEFIGEMSLLSSDRTRTASARTVTMVRVLEMTAAQFDRIIRGAPGLAFEMLRVLSGRLKDAHDTTIHDLQMKNAQLEEAYANLKAAQQQIIEKELLERELAQAREIQMSMLPTVLPQVDHFEVGARMLPARMVGGDFFDVVPLQSGRLGIAVGDVSGKGIPAALFMALSRSLLRAEARDGRSPEQVLRRVNHHLLGMNANGLFVTVLYAVLEGEGRKLRFARAGHERPLLLDAAGQECPVPRTRGQALGLFTDLVLEEGEVELPPGDLLLFYTDGVTDAQNEQGAFFERSGIRRCLQPLAHTSAQRQSDGLVRALQDYQGRAPQTDDVTVVAVRSLG